MYTRIHNFMEMCCYALSFIELHNNLKPETIAFFQKITRRRGLGISNLKKVFDLRSNREIIYEIVISVNYRRRRLILMIDLSQLNRVHNYRRYNARYLMPIRHAIHY